MIIGLPVRLADDSPMRIRLVRHGKPDFDDTVRIAPDGLRAALDGYARSTVTQPPGKDVLGPVPVAPERVIASSELARARASAALLGFEDLRVSPLLNEALLPHPDSLPCQLPWNLVLGGCRIAWLAGYRRNATGIRVDRERAGAASAWLVELAVEHHDVIAFGHGITHGLIARNLAQSGWRTEWRSGNGHWSCRILRREH